MSFKRLQAPGHLQPSQSWVVGWLLNSSESQFGVDHFIYSLHLIIVETRQIDWMFRDVSIFSKVVCHLLSPPKLPATCHVTLKLRSALSFTVRHDCIFSWRRTRFKFQRFVFLIFFMTFGSLKLCQLPVGAGWKVEGGTPTLETGDLQSSMLTNHGLSWQPFDDMSDAWFEPYSTAIHTDRGKTQAWANLMEIIFEHEITIRNNPSSNKWLVPTDGTWMFDIVSLSLQFLCFRFDRKIWWQLMTYIILHPFMKLSTGVILVRSTQGAKVTFIAISSFEWRPFV